MKKILLVVVAVLAVAGATNVKQCSIASDLKTIEQVKISTCEKMPCVLRRGTTISMEQIFVPDRDVSSLTTTVYASIAGVPIPFFGVDGGDACPQIYSLDNQPVGCPLKAGQKYVYKNAFPVRGFYPQLTLIVHWALEENHRPVTCFEVDARIR